MTVHDFPARWQQTSVGSVAELLNGKAFKPSDWSKEGLPIVRIQNLNNAKASYNRYAGEVSTRFLIDSGDLLFAWSGTPGTSFGAHVWKGGPAVLNQHIFNVRFNEQVLDKAFFRLAINQRLDELIDKAHGGVGLRHVTKGKFEETRIPVPPMAEQRRIVAKIDSLSAKLKRGRDRLNHIPRLVEKYKTAVVETALRGRLTQGWRFETKAAEWHQCLASDLFRWASGKNLTSKAMIHGPVPVIGGNGINGSHKHSLVDQPTVVVGRVGAQCGNVHLTSGPAWITDNAIYARTISPRIEPAFALLLLRHADLNGRSGGSGQPYVNQKILDAVEISLPSVNEQREIVRRIETAFAWIDRLAAEATSARDLIKPLEQAMLAKAFRGELVPQEPDEEPASAVSKRIKAESAATPPPGKRRDLPRQSAVP